MLKNLNYIICIPIFRMLLKSEKEGGELVLNALLDESLDQVSGQYLVDDKNSKCKIKKINQMGLNVNDAKKLWTQSVVICKVFSQFEIKTN
jgi:hypothetical protein